MKKIAKAEIDVKSIGEIMISTLMKDKAYDVIRRFLAGGLEESVSPMVNLNSYYALYERLRMIARTSISPIKQIRVLDGSSPHFSFSIQYSETIRGISFIETVYQNSNWWEKPNQTPVFRHRITISSDMIESFAESIKDIFTVIDDEWFTPCYYSLGDDKNIIIPIYEDLFANYVSIQNSIGNTNKIPQIAFDHFMELYQQYNMTYDYATKTIGYKPKHKQYATSTGCDNTILNELVDTVDDVSILYGPAYFGISHANRIDSTRQVIPLYSIHSKLSGTALHGYVNWLMDKYYIHDKLRLKLQSGN